MGSLRPRSLTDQRKRSFAAHQALDSVAEILCPSHASAVDENHPGRLLLRIDKSVCSTISASFEACAAVLLFATRTSI